MKRWLVALLVLLLLTGCAGATLSRISKDGTSLTLTNYAYTEFVYDENKKLIGKNVMIPAQNIVESVLKSLVEAIKSLLTMTDILGDSGKKGDAPTTPVSK